MSGMNKPTSGPWKIKERGWVNSSGEFVRTTPEVDIYPDHDGPGCGIPVATNLKLADAELILALVNNYMTIVGSRP